MKMMLLRSTLLLMISLCLPAWADDQTRLDEVKAEIKKLQSWLTDAREEHDELQQKLRKSDQDIAALLKEIEQTRARLREEQTRLKKLQAEQAQVRQLRNRHQTLLSQQIREARQMGDEAALRFWLTQDDPAQNQRMTRYFGYFNRARLENLTETIAELQRLDNLEVLIAEQQQALQETDTRLTSENNKLASRRSEQQTLLAKLNRQMTSESQRLKQREADRKRLESLLAEVETLVSNSPRHNDEVPFKQMRGKLPRPLNGPVLAAFGNRNGSNARWEGWKIGTHEGADVTAVHHGRVVFSEWLRGFGLLLILDHGDGYLSLYAHNQTLLRDVGSWVNGGEIIATAGKSGGQQSAALYFEIRHKGRPQDPAAWLRRG
ncbi:murein hydrolase activator EnvC [Thalassolituus sp.]|uniref:murein hydrolase activator EnvC family protein n=2 Tax=Thalassolituus sp. TaxID=2030822 RepID=UPI003517EB77